MENKRAVGSRYEAETAAFLQQKGYEILERNFRERRGEIDLIAREGRTLVFVEVKYRKTIKNGYPEEAVDERKQRKIRQTAQYYLYRHQIPEGTPIRFDVVAVLDGQFRLIRDAF